MYTLNDFEPMDFEPVDFEPMDFEPVVFAFPDLFPELSLARSLILDDLERDTSFLRSAIQIFPVSPLSAVIKRIQSLEARQEEYLRRIFYEGEEGKKQRWRKLENEIKQAKALLEKLARTLL